jgi:hypothetical protein
MILALLLATLGPFFASSNFTADLLGPVDVRPGCWGNADVATWTITFRPPPGYRVRVLRLRGDLVAWPRVLPGEKAIEPGNYAGVLLGFQTTAPEGSVRCDWCADNTALYIQDAMSNKPIRAPFNHEIGALLEPDHKLVVKVAAWLNTSGHPIHIEPTFTTVFQFEKDTDGT